MGGVATLYGKKLRNITFPKPEQKTITFEIFTGTDYSSSLYKRLKAEVDLSVYKFSGGNKTLVWQGVIDEDKIKEFPTATKPVYRKVTVYNVVDRKETIAAYYTVRYLSGRSTVSYENGISLSAGSSTDSLKVSL